MTTHSCMVEELYGQFYWQCSCGERAEKFTSLKWEAQEGADQHEQDGRMGRFRVPTSRPTLKTLLKVYRQRQEQETYTPAERAQWKVLADEIEENLPPQKNAVIEGQLSIFD